MEYVKYLTGVEYPVSTQQLLVFADCNQAPSEVLDVMEHLPDVDFESEADVKEACDMTEKALNGKHE